MICNSFPFMFSSDEEGLCPDSEQCQTYVSWSDESLSARMYCFFAENTSQLNHKSHTFCQCMVAFLCEKMTDRGSHKLPKHLISCD